MADATGFRLSILDNVPVWNGSTATQALRNTMRLAPRAEQLGYHRYWISEHHNMRRLATTAPAVLVGQIAGATSTMRIGSGGVLLPNHPPMIVAEQFGTLEALHPGRIDLGIGRSVGTDAATVKLLGGRGETPSPQEFAGQLGELMSYFAGAAEPSEAAAIPAGDGRPPIWLLGSSTSSAAAAGRLGLAYAYAHQINPRHTADAVAAYRENFRPSVYLDEPYCLVSAFVFAGESEDDARRLMAPVQLGFLNVRNTGRTDPYPTPEEAAAYRVSAEERQILDLLFGPQIFGDPEAVREKATSLIATTGADELMAVTLVYDAEDRFRSYQRLAAAVRPVAV
jgi:luciferase family oxidoreductase group 1